MNPGKDWCEMSIIVADAEVGSIYPCGACGSNVTWSRNAVFCETCGIWFHVVCQDR